MERKRRGRGEKAVDKDEEKKGNWGEEEEEKGG